MRKSIRSILALLMVVVSVFGMTGVQAFAAPNYVTAKRVVDPQTIYIDEEAEIKLQVTGTPPVNVVKPNDVILILDKSGSMKDDNRFEAMISSAKEFVDLFDFNAHQVGVVDFSFDYLTNTYPLSTDGNAIKSYLDTISLYGGTHTHAAIRKAMELLEGGREEAQPVIVLLTDGEANDTEAARVAAEEAKNAGIVFYTIALLSPNENPDSSAANDLMMEMATTSHHHHFVLGSVGLMDIYKAIVKEIGIASAYEVKITETVASPFEIVPGSYDHNIPRPTVNGNTLVWDILELKANTLELSYKVRLKDGEVPGTYNVAPNAKIEYKDYAGAKRSYTIPNQNLIVKYKAPTITAITPDKGKIAGGEQITIKGEHFRAGATVKFGANLATDIQVVDANTITATTPVGVQGECIVTVTNDDGQKATTSYQYMADPVITTIEPAQGPFVGGNNVKINGQYFLKGLKVYFGTEEATSVNYYNNTYLLVKAPKAVKEGSVDITIENPDGTSMTITDGYTYEPEIIEKLEITSISPTQGFITGGETITITGKLIDPAAKVYFGNNEATSTTFVNATSIKAIAPAVDTTGKVDVKIENPDGTIATLTEGYEYLSVPAPQITKLSPNIGELVGGELAYVEGQNLVDGVTVTVGGKEASVTNYYGTTKIRIRIPAGDAAGKVDVKVTNPDGQSGELTEGYEYLPAPELPDPEVTKVSPNAGELVGGELIYIEGKNFAKGITVTIGGNTAEVVNYYSPLKIRVKVPAADTPGKVDVTVTNLDGKTASLAEGYEYLTPPEELEPVITLLSTNSGEVPGGEIIYIEGENFQSGLEVMFGDKKAEVLNYYSPVKIRVKVPAADASGTVDVTINNPNGKSGSLADGYTYNAYIPGINSLSATSGQLVGGEIIYINGKNFAPEVEIAFGSEIAQVMNYYDTTRIRVKVPAAAMAGMVDVVATNPDGESGTLVDGYEYLEPAQEAGPEIGKCSLSSSLSGAEITAANKNQIIYIHGDGFKSTSKVKVVDANGTETIVNPLNVYDAKRIRVRIPASTASGTATIKIVNDTLESAGVELTIN